MAQKLIIDIADNPELAAYVASKSPGDECVFTITSTFISADGGKMEADLDEIEFEYEDMDVEVEPSMEDPVAVEIISMSDMEEASAEEGRMELAEELLLDEDDTD